MKTIAAFCLLWAFSAFATESLESDNIQLMVEKAHQLSATYGSNQVLLVYDIDNTLMTANQDLGGDAWFNWQAGKISSGDLTDTVAPDIDGLIKVQTLLFSIGKMHAVDSTTAQVYTQLQNEGYNTILLTSRGTGMRDVTSRELASNGLDTTIKPLGGKGVNGKFLPYDIQHPDLAGLTPEEVTALGLGPAKLASLQNGLFMTDGQHKGAMLRTALFKLHRAFKAILFIDDTAKHVQRMHAAFDPRGVDVVTIRYSKYDPEVKRFETGDKSAVISGWQTLKAAVNTVFAGLNL